MDIPRGTLAYATLCYSYIITNVIKDQILKDAVLVHGGKNWKKISEFLEGRTDVQCLHRWQKVLRPGLVKGPWTKEVY